MEELTPQERFYQLLAFLKNPDKHTFTRSTGDKRFLPIRSMAFPTLSLEDSIFLPGRKHSAGLVYDFRQEAIEVMESNMFRNGLLRGNQRIPDITIKHIEEFVLPIAAVIHISKDYISKSLPQVRSHTFEGKPRLFNELQTAWHELMIAFDKVAKITLGHGLIRPDKLVGLNPSRRAAFEAQIKKLLDEGKYEEIDRILKKTPRGISGELVIMEAQSLKKAHLKEIKKVENSGFDVIDELIPIFLNSVPEAKGPLMARHILALLKKYSGKKERELPGDDAIRKRIELMKKTPIYLQ